MPRFRYECFCEFRYDQELSYDDLLTCEAELTPTVQTILQAHEAAHLDFNPTGDSLFVQCLFGSIDKELFTELCREFTELCGVRVDARIMVFDKHGETLLVGYIAQGKNRLTTLHLPSPKAGVVGKQPVCMVLR